MTKEEFQKILDEAKDRRVALRQDKGTEYTQGDADVLKNFKTGGRDLDLSAMQVWWIYYKKHQDAVLSFIKHGHEFSTEPVDGRIDDMQVYLDLLRGLVAEHKAANVPYVSTAEATNAEEVPF